MTLTQGAFGAIALAFRLVMDAGAEVVIPVPGWFCYAPMLRAADLVPVKAALDAGALRPRPRGDRGGDHARARAWWW